jgi:hypothetical protein
MFSYCSLSIYTYCKEIATQAEEVDRGDRSFDCAAILNFKEREHGPTENTDPEWHYDDIQ